MSQQKHIILIPYWVQEILQRNKLSISDCLDFEKLKPIMALNDLVTFATLQHYVGACTGQPNDELWLGSLFEAWFSGIPADHRDVLEFLTGTVTPMEMDASFRNEVQARLFNPDAKVKHYQNPFITYDLTPKYAGIVIYPGFFSEKTDADLQIQFVEAALKLLYVYQSYNEVSKTSLFRRYLELLSQKQIIV